MEDTKQAEKKPEIDWDALFNNIDNDRSVVFIGEGINNAELSEQNSQANETFSEVIEFPTTNASNAQNEPANINALIHSLGLNLSRLGIDRVMVTLSHNFQRATDTILKVLALCDDAQEAEQKKHKLGEYLDGLNGFLESKIIRKKQVEYLVNACDQLSNTFEDASKDLQLTTLELLYEFYLRISKENDRLRALASLALVVIEQSRNFDQESKHRQIIRLIEMTSGWMNFLYAEPERQLDVYHNFFDRMLAYYDAHPHTWHRLCEVYAQLSTHTLYKQKMLAQVKLRQIRNEDTINAKEIARQIETAFVDTEASTDEAREQDRQDLLEAMDTLIKKIAINKKQKSDPILDAKYQEIAKQFLKHDASMMRAIGIALIAVAIVLAVGAITLFSFHFAQFAASQVPIIIETQQLTAAISLTCASVACGVLGGILFWHGQPNNMAKAFLAFDKALHGHDGFSKERETDPLLYDPTL